MGGEAGVEVGPMGAGDEDEGTTGAGDDAEEEGAMTAAEVEEGATTAAEVVGAVAGDEETGLAGAVPAPPPNLAAKHFSIKGTSVSPSGTSEST